MHGIKISECKTNFINPKRGQKKKKKRIKKHQPVLLHGKNSPNKHPYKVHTVSTLSKIKTLVTREN